MRLPTYKITTDKDTWLPLRFQQMEEGVPTRPAVPGRPLQRATAGERVLAAGGRGAGRAHGRGLPARHLGGGGRPPGSDAARAGFVPAGFSLAAAAVAEEALTANHLVRTRDIFELQYTHGFDALTVSTRTIADPSSRREDDPVDAYDPLWTDLVRPGPDHLRRLRRPEGEHRGRDHVVRASPLGRQGRRPPDDRGSGHGRGAPRGRELAAGVPGPAAD